VTQSHRLSLLLILRSIAKVSRCPLRVHTITSAYTLSLFANCCRLSKNKYGPHPRFAVYGHSARYHEQRSTILSAQNALPHHLPDRAQNNSDRAWGVQPEHIRINGQAPESLCFPVAPIVFRWPDDQRIRPLRSTLCDFLISYQRDYVLMRLYF